ncbi:Linear gramicidin synthase subunit D [Hypsizygus marmoreus]|uniref:Linear gramicidin synthase subunit D n=1 Tax=Hypsizygus marmoreus TaxID=39966 RepID=A0A369JJU8_HYPMA|nr:Linear gramicidin synthase subunit D [Hypsizygus marmoreus]
MESKAFHQELLQTLSPVGRALFSRFGRGSGADYPFKCIHQAFEYHARHQPDGIAVEELQAKVTYGELDGQANCLASRLRDMGIVPGSRVGLLVERSIHMVVGILAILKAGGAYVPLDGDVVSNSTLAHALRDSDASLVLIQRRFSDRIFLTPTLCLEDFSCPHSSKTDCVKPADLSDPSDSAYIIYTSGTTGMPKGVDVMHRNVTNLVCLGPGNLAMSPGLRVSQIMNISFDMAAWEILGSLCNGSTLCLRGKTSKDWRSIMRTVDIVIATPSILALHDPADYPNIKVVAVAGEPCPKGLADSWAQTIDFYNCCGPTEAAIVNTMHRHAPGETLGIGGPIPNTTVYILDDQMKPVKIGETGLIWAGGAGISRGYLNLPEETAQKYKLDPFLNDGSIMFNTGDLGRWYPDGNLEHLGRIDDQVKVKGFRVELDGVAAAMENTPGVKVAAAMLIEGELWGFYAPSTIAIEEVKASTLRIQPYYAVPTKYLRLDGFPQTPNGKVDRKALRRLIINSSQYIAVPPSPPGLPPLEAPVPQLNLVNPLRFNPGRGLNSSKTSVQNSSESSLVFPTPPSPPPVPARSRARPSSQQHWNHSNSSLGDPATDLSRIPSPSPPTPPPIPDKSTERYSLDAHDESTVAEDAVTEVPRIPSPPPPTPPPVPTKSKMRTPSPGLANPAFVYQASNNDSGSVKVREWNPADHVEIFVNLPLKKEINPSALEDQTSIWAGYKQDVLPDNREGQFLHNIRFRAAYLFRRFFGLVFLTNLLIFIIIASKGANAGQISKIVVGNIFVAVLMRQDYIVEAFFLICFIVPLSWPLSVRRAVAASIYHLGGLHFGAGASAVLWQILFAAQATKEMSHGHRTTSGTLAIAYLILILLLVITLFSHSKLRHRFRNNFEAVHGFLGWNAINLIFIQVILLANDYRSQHQSLGMALAQSATFWLVLMMMASLAVPWIRLRKVDVVYCERLSSHAMRMYFDYVTPRPGSFVKLSDKPLAEWHSFATLPEPGKPGFSVVVSQAGDWAVRQISSPPTKMWIRGIPTSGVMRIATMFRRIVLVATGSGIGPCIPVVLEKKLPIRLLWIGSNVRETFGNKLVDTIVEANPQAVIYNTRQYGKPDMLKLTYRLVKEFEAEAVVIISNRKLTEKVVYEMMSRGIPAFGAM